MGAHAYHALSYRTQRGMTLSISEAENVAMTDAVLEILFSG